MSLDTWCVVRCPSLGKEGQPTRSRRVGSASPPQPIMPSCEQGMVKGSVVLLACASRGALGLTVCLWLPDSLGCGVKPSRMPGPSPKGEALSHSTPASPHDLYDPCPLFFVHCGSMCNGVSWTAGLTEASVSALPPTQKTTQTSHWIFWDRFRQCISGLLVGQSRTSAVQTPGFGPSTVATRITAPLPPTTTTTVQCVTSGLHLSVFLIGLTPRPQTITTLLRPSPRNYSATAQHGA